ncbi:helix-turn-helix domain-containing protein [Lysinibacillus telephonicus]|uniref:helix-turn-helix domain-containing protein n=1 Tax=Lysinibacillus telephonicus TaxID=1714840 RepID=UPI0031FCB257
MEYHIQNRDDFIKYVKSEVLTSSEVLEVLGVSRQSLNSLVKRGKLVPIKELSRDKLFLREDIERRKEESKELHSKYRPYDE